MERKILLNSTPAEPFREEVVVELLKVTVTDIQVSADIGIYPHEIGRRQSLRIDVTLTLAPAVADSPLETLDYATIMATAVELGDERTALIEDFARRLAGIYLTFPLVSSAEITVAKPEALDNGLASIRMVLSRASP